MQLSWCFQRIQRFSRGTALRMRVALVDDSHRGSHQSLTQYGRHFQRSSIAQSVTMNPAMTNPNMIVVDVPIPREVLANYASRSSYVLGGIQMGMGVVLLIVNIFIIATFGAYFSTGRSVSEFGGCVLFLITGVCGIATGSTKTSCSITGFMVMSIISSVFATIGFVLSIVAAVQFDNINENRQLVRHREAIVAVVIACIIVYFVESVASIWSAVICGKNVCCGQRSNGAIVHQILTTTREPIQAGESNSFSEISFGPPPVY
ncbi:hypothetical protein LSAT2_014491 [Lamellibrachia satsuma]|nr:hypothetical protein LSAT2_014491 [Lamellibrachia satsuma]